MIRSNDIPLQHTWSMWTSKWKGKPNMQFLSQFDTIQSFWTNFKLTPPTELADKSYLHIFKNGVAPMWEDPQNVNGGHFKLTASTQESSLAMWQSIVLNMIGEQCPSAQFINGGSIVVHGVGNNLIKLWLSTTDKEVVAQTKLFLSQILDPAHYLTDKITFVPHKLVLPSANSRRSSTASQETSSRRSSVASQEPNSLNSRRSSVTSQFGDTPVDSNEVQSHFHLPQFNFPLPTPTMPQPPLSKKSQKRRKSREIPSTPSTPGMVKKDLKKDFTNTDALTKFTKPASCGPAEVRFAHDPYSVSGRCMYIPSPIQRLDHFPLLDQGILPQLACCL